MSKRNRKRTMNNRVYPAASSEPVSTKAEPKKSANDLLFRPLFYKRTRDQEVQFEYMRIPFLIKDNRTFMLSFSDGCGDTSIYTEMYVTDPGEPVGSFEDHMEIMKECLEIEKLTGVTYHYGKLDKAVQEYLYGLQLFVDRKIMTKEQALALAGDLGFDIDDIMAACQSVSDDLEKSKMRYNRMNRDAKARQVANEAMTKFIMSMLSGEEEKKEDDENPDTETPAEELPDDMK